MEFNKTQQGIILMALKQYLRLLEANERRIAKLKDSPERNAAKLEIKNMIEALTKEGVAE